MDIYKVTLERNKCNMCWYYKYDSLMNHNDILYFDTKFLMIDEWFYYYFECISESELFNHINMIQRNIIMNNNIFYWIIGYCQ